MFLVFLLLNWNHVKYDLMYGISKMEELKFLWNDVYCILECSFWQGLSQEKESVFLTFRKLIIILQRSDLVNKIIKSHKRLKSWFYMEPSHLRHLTCFCLIAGTLMLKRGMSKALRRVTGLRWLWEKVTMRHSSGLNHPFIFIRYVFLTAPKLLA